MKIIYSTLLYIEIALLFVFISSGKSYAHVLKTDGSIGAVIHVTPEDDPIAGESTDFFFEFKDKTKKFKAENCDCNGIILQDGKIIYSTPLFQNKSNPSLDNTSFSFVFPEKAIYQVRVSGTPTIPGEFKQFTLDWDIRVARDSENNSNKLYDSNKNSVGSWLSTHFVHLILIIPAIVFMLAYLYKENKSKKKGGEK